MVVTVPRQVTKWARRGLSERPQLGDLRETVFLVVSTYFVTLGRCNGADGIHHEGPTGLSAGPIIVPVVAVWRSFARRRVGKERAVPQKFKYVECV